MFLIPNSSATASQPDGVGAENGHRAGRAVGRARLAVPALVLVHVRLAGFRVDGQRAEQACRQRLEKDPDNRTALRSLGDVSRKLGNLAEASRGI